VIESRFDRAQSDLVVFEEVDPTVELVDVLLADVSELLAAGLAFLQLVPVRRLRVRQTALTVDLLLAERPLLHLLNFIQGTHQNDRLNWIRVLLLELIQTLHHFVEYFVVVLGSLV